MPAPVVPEHFQHGHLYAGAAADLLIKSRGTYFREAVAWPGMGPSFWLIYRRLEIDYLSEAFEGEDLFCGVRTMSIGRRSVQLQQAIWTGDGRAVIGATSAEVAFDVTERQAVDVPGDLALAIRRYEGDDRVLGR